MNRSENRLGLTAGAVKFLGVGQESLGGSQERNRICRARSRNKEFRLGSVSDERRLIYQSRSKILVSVEMPRLGGGS